MRNSDLHIYPWRRCIHEKINRSLFTTWSMSLFWAIHLQIHRDRSCPSNVTRRFANLPRWYICISFCHRPDRRRDDCLGLDSCSGSSDYVSGESKEFEFAKSAAVREDIVNGVSLCRWSREGGRQIARDSAFEAAPPALLPCSHLAPHGQAPFLLCHRLSGVWTHWFLV